MHAPDFLSRTGAKELIDVITNHAPNEGNPSGQSNGRTHAERVSEALGNMFMDITCSHCGSNKVIRAGACGVCTECGASQGVVRLDLGPREECDWR